MHYSSVEMGNLTRARKAHSYFMVRDFTVGRKTTFLLIGDLISGVLPLDEISI